MTNTLREIIEANISPLQICYVKNGDKEKLVDRVINLLQTQQPELFVTPSNPDDLSNDDDEETAQFFDQAVAEQRRATQKEINDYKKRIESDKFLYQINFSGKEQSFLSKALGRISPISEKLQRTWKEEDRKVILELTSQIEKIGTALKCLGRICKELAKEEDSSSERSTTLKKWLDEAINFGKKTIEHRIDNKRKQHHRKPERDNNDEDPQPHFKHPNRRAR